MTIKMNEFILLRDKTGNSKIYSIIYYFKPYPSQAISINCSHFTNESNIQRTLNVDAQSEEFAII